MIKNYYWDEVSEEIGKVFLDIFEKDKEICEIGFGSGHFLEWLNEQGFLKLIGVEIREDVYNETFSMFDKKQLPITLILGDAKKIEKKYDYLYSTGLLQCLDGVEVREFLEKISEISRNALFVVPEILQDRNTNADKKIGVNGCKEYKTSNLPYTLSLFYDNVKVGKIDKAKIKNDDNFLYYICSKY